MDADGPEVGAEGDVVVPAGLRASGADLWRDVMVEFEFDTHERLLLLQLCRTADRLDQLAAEAAIAPVTTTNSKGDEVAHPALTESRQQALVYARLLASLRLPSGEDDGDRPQRRGGARGAYGVRKTA